MTLTASPRTDDPGPARHPQPPPGWRNPRLLLGLLLVAASVVLGRAADGRRRRQRGGVGASPATCPPGATVSAEDLEPRSIRFPDAATADRYLPSGDALPGGSVLDRPLSAGELLPRAALESGDRPDLVEVPVSVAADDLPATVRQGSVVDVWVTPQGGRRPGRPGPRRSGCSTTWWSSASRDAPTAWRPRPPAR